MNPAGHLIVDGYNLAYAWTDTRVSLRRQLDVAADRVIARVRIIHDVLGWSVTVVFDGKGSRLSILHPDETDSFTVVYSAAGQTADTVIEQLMVRAPSTEGWRLVSNDRALGQMALGSGVEVLSTDALHDWITQTERASADSMRRQNAKNDVIWRRRGKIS